MKAVLLDLGGVYLESPLEAVAAYEHDNRIPPGTLNRLVAAAGEEGAWARHERGEIGFARFCDVFESEMAAAGVVVDAGEIMARIAATIRPQAEMAGVVKRLRAAGIRVAAVTNNWESLRNEALAPEFDVMVESCREGVRKPNPEIYRRALARLGARAEDSVVLDDLGPNLKTAREMGMATFKVTAPSEAVEFLEGLIGTG